MASQGHLHKSTTNNISHFQLDLTAFGRVAHHPRMAEDGTFLSKIFLARNKLSDVVKLPPLQQLVPPANTCQVALSPRIN